MFAPGSSVLLLLHAERPVDRSEQLPETLRHSRYHTDLVVGHRTTDEKFPDSAMKASKEKLISPDSSNPECTLPHAGCDAGADPDKTNRSPWFTKGNRPGDSPNVEKH